MTLNKPGHVIVDTTNYERNHGGKPRGQGSWAFCTVDPRRDDYLNHVMWFNGSYSEAKKQAQAQAAGRFIVIYVCS
jgi:hypothetical protein